MRLLQPRDARGSRVERARGSHGGGEPLEP
jgi:hypothetical protein